MKRIDMISNLRSELLTICDTVEKTFIFPNQDNPEMFPYMCIQIGTFSEIQKNTGKQRISIFGFVYGDKEDLTEKSIALSDKTIDLIQKSNSVKLIIESGDNSNLFKPLGLDAGVYPPLAGFRIDCIMPFDI